MMDHFRGHAKTAPDHLVPGTSETTLVQSTMVPSAATGSPTPAYSNVQRMHPLQGKSFFFFHDYITPLILFLWVDKDLLIYYMLHLM